jgi:CheY-like chemotaxis protein
MDVNVDVITSQLFKVLVVEDNKINQIIIQKNIEKNNGSCILVNDGFKAIDILKTEKFDVILMDINMPLLNGFETTRKIRENGIQTPIIALTAFDREEVAEEVFSSGMNEIIIKPFEGPKLFQLITDQINSSKNTKQS